MRPQDQRGSRQPRRAGEPRCAVTDSPGRRPPTGTGGATAEGPASVGAGGAHPQQGSVTSRLGPGWGGKLEASVGHPTAQVPTVVSGHRWGRGTEVAKVQAQASGPWGWVRAAPAALPQPLSPPAPPPGLPPHLTPQGSGTRGRRSTSQGRHEETEAQGGSRLPRPHRPL